jgi:hypothetical protein
VRVGARQPQRRRVLHPQLRIKPHHTSFIKTKHHTAE